MRDLATLFDSKISGAFPNVQAINASSETAFDGTPWLNLNVNDLIIGPIQALFALAGKTPNGVAEVAGTSQILDILRMIAEYKAETIVSATQTEAPGELSRLYTCDASLGGFTLTIGDGAFDGQKILVSVPDDAIGLVYVKGTGTLDGNNRRTGIYSGASDLGTPISAGLSLSMEWSSTRSQWVPVNAIAADYVSGNYTVKQSSYGDMDSLFSDSVQRTATTLTGSVYLATSNQYTYPVPFLSVPITVTGAIEPSANTAAWSSQAYTVLSTSHYQRLIGAINTAAGYPTFNSKGKY